MVEFRVVGKAFGAVTVLRDFDLSLGAHDRIGLLGESGAGKSTILRLIAGLIQPDTGIVSVGSEKIGYIFQDHRLIPWRTAAENVAFGLVAAGIGRHDAMARAKEILYRVELGGFEHYYPSQLSGGMCQRVSIARAFVVSPQIILMDEPFSALDPQLKQRMNRLVSALLAETPACVVYVTHNKQELVGLTDTVYKLSRGGGLELRRTTTTARSKQVKDIPMRQHLDLDMDKIEKIMEIKLRVFRKELSVAEARELVNRTFDRVTAQEFAYGEQQMLDHGITDDAMTEEMDEIIEVFRDVLGHDEDSLPAGHPIDTYRKEAVAIEDVLARMEQQKTVRFVVNEWLALYDELAQINIHLSRKQNQLFPILEHKGFDRPSKVMWTFDNRVRDAIRDARALLENDNEAAFLEAHETVDVLVRDILEKEREVLYPTSLKLITEEEFAQMRSGDDEIGYCLIDPPPEFTAAGGGPATATSGSDLVNDLQAVLQRHGVATAGARAELDVSTGKLTLEQINLMFRHLPIDLSFVDEHDLVRFYSDTQHRVFPRSPGVIGRAVQNCHPRESADTVQKIIDAFRAGTQNEAEFWLEMGDRFVYILYTAVRDEAGKFRGVLEMMQDATHIRELSGSQRLLSWETTGEQAGNSLAADDGSQPAATVDTSSGPIGSGTIIGDLVEQHPFLKDYLVSLNPKFRKLKNPILFKTMGRIATLEMVAERGGMQVGELIELLQAEIDRQT